ncbi:hypothetical protein GH714_041928 [Hevea brasiliensis]|uniref:TF-B3 domain-containing protein n=1 Tax=Hevea brasiliensis TaxID=3981 RepID=A0A6A6MU56_HEVBR|nr:hypothetical protein GH714_041928 [Hevea brasiliensis]
MGVAYNMVSRPSMGSCGRPSCRQSTSRVERSWSSFFSKIRASTIEDKKLNLPLMFVRKYGDELSDVAKLIASNGLIWEVGLTKGKMIIWFDDGWHEFVEYYSVRNGWLLIFNYIDGIDLSLQCEEEGNIFTSKNFYVTLSKVSPESKKAVDAAMECKPKNPAFLVIVGQHLVGQNTMHVPSEFAKRFLHNIYEIIKVQDSDGEEWIREWIIHTTCCWRGGSLSLIGGWAEFFRDNEFGDGDKLPVKFVRKYGDELSDVAKLIAPNGLIWEVGLTKGAMIICSSKGASSKKRDYATTQQNLARPVFGSGNLGINKSFKDAASAEKRKFQQEYQKKGENCEMEDLPNANDSNLDGIDSSPGCEEFNIFTSKQFYATLSKISPESKKAVDAAMECKPKNPAFLVILRQHFVGDNAMHVPSAFAKSFLRNISEMIKVQDSNGGEWIIHTDCYWRGGYLSLRGGWAKFFSDNELVVGDVCLFELIRKKNVALKVSVFHAFMD